MLEPLLSLNRLDLTQFTNLVSMLTPRMTVLLVSMVLASRGTTKIKKTVGVKKEGTMIQ